MKYFLLAGEASGDNLGALLMTHLKELDSDAEFCFFGGDAMATASGLSPKRHIREMAFMGFVEVVRNLPTILKLIRQAKREILSFEPDVLVCIDYPGFNLRIASWARKNGIWVTYYVSPQIWAWRQSRVHRIARSTDRILTILPFEQQFYERYGYEVDYVGHPLPRKIDRFGAPSLDVLLPHTGERNEGDIIVALLPGSRRQEIDALLPVFVAAVAKLRSDDFPGMYRPVLAASPALSDEELEELCETHKIEAVRDVYGLLSHANLAAVASGTATLETALFGVPQVVCYRGSAVSVAIARRLIKVPYISLVNLILDAEVVPELVQAECSAESLATILSSLHGTQAGQRQQTQYARLRQALEPYEATARAAESIAGDAKRLSA